MTKTMKIEDIEEVKFDLMKGLLEAEEVDVGTWHAQNVSGKPELVSRELPHISYRLSVPWSLSALQRMYKPNLPWAEDHFRERICGDPLNPPPSEKYWPFAVKGNEAHKEGELFSHTYPERYWPKEAGDGWNVARYGAHRGIRYSYGDLDDVIDLLDRQILTRQAYLPVWFPEDTGALEGQRLPCSLGYHFLCRKGEMDITYYLRSCDFMRHWADDMYMTARLLQHVVGKLQETGHNITARSMVVHISSLHVFNGDIPLLGKWFKDSLMTQADAAGI